MKVFIAIFVTIFCAQAEIFDRKCRSLEEYGGVKTGFEPEKYLGQWYEIERYEQSFQRERDCCFAEYKFNSDGSVNVINRSKNITDGTWSFAEGKAVVSYPLESNLRAMLNVTFPAFRVPDRSNYWILSTDYINYSIVVSCRDLNENQSVEAYWLLSRNYPIAEEGRKIADEIVAAKLDSNRIRKTTQDPEKCGMN